MEVFKHLTDQVLHSGGVSAYLVQQRDSWGDLNSSPLYLLQRQLLKSHAVLPFPSSVPGPFLQRAAASHS